MTVEDVAMSVLAVLLLLFVGALGVGILRERQSPVFELRKDQWECVRTFERSYFSPVMTGKAVVMIPHKEVLCSEYRIIGDDEHQGGD